MFEWIKVIEGSYVLVIGRGMHAAVYHYTRSRSIQHSFLLRWEKMVDLLPSARYMTYNIQAGTDASLATHYPLSCVASSSSGVLLLANGPHISVYTTLQDSQEHLIEATVAECSSLPAYHPHILFELMSSSRFQPAIQIVRHLLHSVRAIRPSSGNSSLTLFVPDLPFSDLLPLIFSSR